MTSETSPRSTNSGRTETRALAHHARRSNSECATDLVQLGIVRHRVRADECADGRPGLAIVPSSAHPNRELAVYGAERLEKAIAHVVVGNDLDETQDVLVAQSNLPEQLNIARVARLGRTRHLDRKIGDSLFARCQVCLGKIISYLLCKFLISYHSTEGCQMTGGSVRSTIVR